MAIIDFDTKGNPRFADLKELRIGKEAIKILEEGFSIETFIKRVKALCNLKS